MKKMKSLAFFLALVMIISILPISGAALEYEWWDLRGYTEQEYDSSVAGVDSPFAGWRDLTGTYGENGQKLSVRHYWGWYVENPNSTRQRIDIYVPSHATENSPILHMVDNTGWTSNGYPYSAPEYNAETGIFAPGNNTSANALSRGYIVMACGARSYGMPSDTTGKSPATFVDYKAAMRFLRANMGQDKAIKVGDPDLAFVVGFSGGGALSNILGASGNSPDYFAGMYQIGALGLEWTSATSFELATLNQKTDKASWSNTISDAYLGVVSWAGMDDFCMGEQAMAWFASEKRWAQSDPNVKTPLLMTTANALAAEYVDYVNDLAINDENGQPLTATFTVKENPEEGGVAGGSLLDATVGLMEGALTRALKLWKTGWQTTTDAAPFAVSDSLDPLWSMAVSEPSFNPMAPVYDYSKVNASVLINGAVPTGKLADPANIPTDPVVEITDHTQFTLGLLNKLDKCSIFPYSSKIFGFIIFQPDEFDEITDTAGLYGADDQVANATSKQAWDWFSGSGETYPRVGKVNNDGMEWEDYLKTEAGQTQALQMKMATSMPYLNADNLAAFPYLKTAGVYGSDVTETAKYWFMRFGMNDQSCSFSMRTLLYYSLMNNENVDFDMSDVCLFTWNKPHDSNYENIFPWIDKVVADYTHVDYTGGDMKNFTLTGTYPGYPDVDENLWYGIEKEGVIRESTLLGIVQGDGEGFKPDNSIKLCEVIKMAAVVYNSYFGGMYEFNQTEGRHWYDTYVNFAVRQGIIKADDFADYDRNATRAQMAYVFAGALPAGELAAKSELAPPDVAKTDKYASEILLLYAAGVLRGNDELGTFTPEREITRAEAAAIITRVALPDKR